MVADSRRNSQRIDSSAIQPHSFRDSIAEEAKLFQSPFSKSIVAFHDDLCFRVRGGCFLQSEKLRLVLKFLIDPSTNLFLRRR